MAHPVRKKSGFGERRRRVTAIRRARFGITAAAAFARTFSGRHGANKCSHAQTLGILRGYAAFMLLTQCNPATYNRVGFTTLRFSHPES